MSDFIFQKILYYFCLKILFVFINSTEPDEMQHYAAFHLGLHCLQKYSFRGHLGFWVRESKAEWNCLGNFCHGAYEEHLCKIILNLGQQFRWRCCLKKINFLFLALVAILFRGTELFGQFQRRALSGTFE